MTSWCEVKDKDLGKVIINISNVKQIYKSFLCDNEPTIIFLVGDENDYIAIFDSEKERDEFFDNLKNKLNA